MYYSGLFFISILFSFNVFPLVVGSTTSVTWQGSTTFPAAAMDNTILGFTFMTDGFTLQDQTTTLTYDAVYSVVGDVALNGGTLYLDQDLVLNNVATFTSLGNINGQEHLFGLSSMLNTLGAINQGLFTFNNIEVQLNGNLTFNANINFQGTSIINGKNSTLDLSSTASIVVGSNSTLVLKDLIIVGVQAQNISCLDDSSSIVLDNCCLVLEDNFTFTKGSFLFTNLSDIVGTHTFTYSSSQTSTVSSDSVLTIGSGTRLLIGRSQPNGNEPLAFVDQTSIMHLENSVFATNPNGIELTKGKIQFARDVTFEINSTSTANGVIVGDGIAADDVFFELFPGASVIFSYGHIVFDITKVNVIKSHSDTAQIIRLAPTVFYINQNLTSSNITLNSSFGATSVIAPGKTLSYDSTTFISPLGSFQAQASQNVVTTLELTGNNKVTVISGDFPFLTSISNVNNSFGGNGTIISPVTLQNSGAQLIWAVNGPLSADIIMNGGTLALASNLVCTPDVVLSGSGNVSLGTNRFTLGTSPITWNDAVTWIGSNGVLRLQGPLTLDSTWTFSGQCTLDGNGQTLDLTSGNLVVAPGSTLTLNNIVIKNISGTAISCVDNTGQIILNNVSWMQNGDFEFATGAMQFSHQNLFQGDGVLFVYDTIMTSTILAQSSILLDSGFTLSYDPSNNSSLLLQCIDNTSVINLKSSTIHATSGGLQLTKGSLQIISNSTLESEGSTGITFGNDNPANDFACTIFNGVSLNVALGILNYRNASLISLQTGNPYSKLIMNDNTRFNLYESIVVGEGIIQFNSNVTFGQAAGVTITGSIAPLGPVNYVTI